MGGWTKIQLKDVSQINIDAHNTKLEILKVPKKYRFQSESNTTKEYEYFKSGLGHFPDHMFPKDKIKSLADFKQYWNSKALGEIFVPPNGALTFDCYFGRTSDKAMRKIGKYVAQNWNDISKVGGSFSTFIERGMTKAERDIVSDYELKE